jgi:hypothetical protein
MMRALWDWFIWKLFDRRDIKRQLRRHVGGRR